MTTYVYIVRAPADTLCDEYSEDYDGKIVGVYATRELAEKALEEALSEPDLNPAYG